MPLSEASRGCNPHGRGGECSCVMVVHADEPPLNREALTRNGQQAPCDVVLVSAGVPELPE